MSAKRSLALGLILLGLGACTTGLEEAHTSTGVQPAITAQTQASGLRGRAYHTGREQYQDLPQNREQQVAWSPVSTFSIDVDTGAYANVRRFLEDGRLPPHEAVRVEEMINYFSYDYPRPRGLEEPFRVVTEVAPTPWNEETYLLHIGIQGYDVERAERPPANLVFLVDVSGSMQSKDKLPLLVRSLKMLTEELTGRDRISLVVYAGSSGVVLEPTPGSRKFEIIEALDDLEAGGSTAGGAGLRLAYRMAEEGWIEGGINRVLLATDGDFNVGITDTGALKKLIEKKRDSGIALTTLGFGTGNYNEHLMEQLADVGNGNYAYIDRVSEARKVLVQEMTSTLLTIAKDVKVQIEFNPAVVASYRQIGYENRALSRRDFANDRVDAGDIGAGHSVTALYEVTPVEGYDGRVAPLRYAKAVAGEEVRDDEFAFLKLRYKAPEGGPSRLIERPLATAMLTEARESGGDLRFAAAVAAFGQLLRGGGYLQDFGYDEVMELALSSLGEDRHGYRGGFVDLVQTAAGLDRR